MSINYDHILEINALEWFDKVNGNSYFSATITLDDRELAPLTFQYGHGDHYIDMAKKELVALQLPLFECIGRLENLAYYCREHRIKLITHKQENCLKRDLLK